jgi:hypothetical protein
VLAFVYRRTPQAVVFVHEPLEVLYELLGSFIRVHEPKGVLSSKSAGLLKLITSYAERQNASRRVSVSGIVHASSPVEGAVFAGLLRAGVPQTYPVGAPS